VDSTKPIIRGKIRAPKAPTLSAASSKRVTNRAPKAPTVSVAPAKRATNRKPPASAEARIRAAIRAVPVGTVAGYGVIARRAGLPGRARLVAKILSNNDDPTLPWHRVLRSDGRIAFPADSEGHAEQTQRLRAEGVTVEAGRVRGMPRVGGDLDELLWAPPRR
jgi:methylated-DNA-protein-cysteine methyltransferase-like protein